MVIGNWSLNIGHLRRRRTPPRLFFMAAAIKAAKSGCGALGFDWNSG
jgi:hypothetical protein